MAIVSIKDEYIEILSSLGDLQESMDLALKQYTIFVAECMRDESLDISKIVTFCDRRTLKSYFYTEA